MVEFRAPGCAAYRQNTPRKSGYSALPDGGWCATADVETLTRASWSPAYAMVGAAPAGADRMYFAFVNNTTLGYGDIIPTEEWRLLGPMMATKMGLRGRMVSPSSTASGALAKGSPWVNRPWRPLARGPA